MAGLGETSSREIVRLQLNRESHNQIVRVERSVVVLNRVIWRPIEVFFLGPLILVLPVPANDEPTESEGSGSEVDCIFALIFWWPHYFGAKMLPQVISISTPLSRLPSGRTTRPGHLVWKQASRIAERESAWLLTHTKLVLVECVAGWHVPLTKPPVAGAPASPAMAGPIIS